MATQPKEPPEETARITYETTRDTMGFSDPQWDELHEETKQLYRKRVSDNEYYRETQAQMTIDINKKYRTRSGLDVEIFKVLDNNYPDVWKVLGAVIPTNKTYDLTRWLANGKFNPSKEPGLSGYDLCEVSPYDDLKIDDKVIVWNEGTPENDRRHRYFAGVTVDGKPTTFLSGATNWSAPRGQRTLTWDHCIKYTEGT